MPSRTRQRRNSVATANHHDRLLGVSPAPRRLVKRSASPLPAKLRPSSLDRSTACLRTERTRDHGRCPVRTGDLLLVRGEQSAAVAAACCSGWAGALDPRLAAAVCCFQSASRTTLLRGLTELVKGVLRYRARAESWCLTAQPASRARTYRCTPWLSRLLAIPTDATTPSGRPQPRRISSHPSLPGAPDEASL